MKVKAKNNKTKEERVPPQHINSNRWVEGKLWGGEVDWCGGSSVQQANEAMTSTNRWLQPGEDKRAPKTKKNKQFRLPFATKYLLSRKERGCVRHIRCASLLDLNRRAFEAAGNKARLDEALEVSSGRQSATTSSFHAGLPAFSFRFTCSKTCISKR